MKRELRPVTLEERVSRGLHPWAEFHAPLSLGLTCTLCKRPAPYASGFSDSGEPMGKCEKHARDF